MMVLLEGTDSNSSQKRLYCCFIDFHKAFDRVWRTGLLWKLKNYGINGNYFMLIKSMYENVNYSVKTNNSFTDNSMSNIGVKQGCNLSLTLFNIYLNDLPGIFYSELPYQNW